jgi:hypothetical protein
MERSQIRGPSFPALVFRKAQLKCASHPQSNDGVVNALTNTVLPLLDDATQLTGDASQFMAQLQQRKQPCVSLEVPKARFQVTHYAGPVAYQAAQMTVANLDVLAINAVRLCSSSSNGLIAQWFAAPAAEAAAPPTRAQPAAAASRNVSGNSSPALRRNTAGAGAAARKASVASKFRTQLSGLMDELQRTECHFIRTVKPNPDKKPNMFLAEPNVRTQLEQGGVIEGMTYGFSPISHGRHTRAHAHRELTLPQFFTDSIALTHSLNTHSTLRLDSLQSLTPLHSSIALALVAQSTLTSLFHS